MPGLSAGRTTARPIPARWRTVLDAHVIAAEWAANDALAVALSIEGRLAACCRDTGALLYAHDAHGGGGTTLACQPGGALVATGGQDATVRIWMAATGAPVRTLPVDAAWVEQVHWNRAGTLLAAAAGRAVHVWRIDGTEVRVWPRHRATVTDVQWHPTEDRLCATSYGGVTILHPSVPAPAAQFAWQGSSLCARWSPDGRYIATGEQDASVHFWIVATGKDLQMTGYPSKIHELAWDRSSRYLATGGGPEAIVWDCGGRGPAGSTPIILPGHETRVSALAWQHAGSRLVTGGTDGRVVLWQPAATRPLAGATSLSSGVTTLHWTADDRDLLVGTADGGVVALGL